VTHGTLIVMQRSSTAQGTLPSKKALRPWKKKYQTTNKKQKKKKKKKKKKQKKKNKKTTKKKKWRRMISRKTAIRN